MYACWCRHYLQGRHYSLTDCFLAWKVPKSRAVIGSPEDWVTLSHKTPPPHHRHDTSSNITLTGYVGGNCIYLVVFTMEFPTQRTLRACHHYSIPQRVCSAKHREYIVMNISSIRLGCAK